MGIKSGSVLKNQFNGSSNDQLSPELIERMRKRKCFADKELEEMPQDQQQQSLAQAQIIDQKNLNLQRQQAQQQQQQKFHDVYSILLEQSKYYQNLVETSQSSNSSPQANVFFNNGFNLKSQMDSFNALTAYYTQLSNLSNVNNRENNCAKFFEDYSPRSSKSEFFNDDLKTNESKESAFYQPTANKITSDLVSNFKNEFIDYLSILNNPASIFALLANQLDPFKAVVQTNSDRSANSNESKELNDSIKSDIGSKSPKLDVPKAKDLNSNKKTNVNSSNSNRLTNFSVDALLGAVK
jgi:hypothetical protein